MDLSVSRCSVCGTSTEDDMNYLNTSIKMLISKCGHRFCDQCIKREFQHHRELSCPSCGKSVKKSQLQDKTIEQVNYAKEISIRKKVLKDYNKTEEDFTTLDEYNTYLEELENLIFDLVYGDEAEKSNAQKKWKLYRQENLAIIATNDAKKAEEERRIAQLLIEQQRIAEERRQLQKKEDSQLEQDLERQKTELNEVALGERDASDVTQIRSTATLPIGQNDNTPAMEAMMVFNNGFQYGSQPVPVPGGKRGSHFGMHETKSLRRDQQRAGGYNPDLHCKRNRSEAWDGIMLPWSR